ncbi:MAG: hypothetical protein Q7S14_03400 [bacterium]|nr:hypothetical protein [bacterium]
MDLIIPSLDFYFYNSDPYGMMSFYKNIKLAGVDYTDPGVLVNVNEFVRSDPSKTMNTVNQYLTYINYATLVPVSNINIAMTELWFGCDQEEAVIQNNINYLQNNGVQSIYLHPVSWGNWNSCDTGPAQMQIIAP